MFTFQSFFPGKVLEYLKPKRLSWLGYGASSYHSHQSIELEILKANEYDTYIKDPSDFMLRSYISRTGEAAESFQVLPQIASIGQNYQGALALDTGLVRTGNFRVMINFTRGYSVCN